MCDNLIVSRFKFIRLGRGDDLRGLVRSRGGLGRRRELGVAIEDDGIEELVVFAGGLGAAGLFVHLAADLHDHIGDGATGGGDGFGEDGGEEAVLGLAAGFRCVDDDGVFRLGLDDGESARGRAGGGGERIIAAGIEHDDVCSGARGVEGGHDFIELHGAGGDAFFIGDVGIGGDEVIAAIHLHAVAAVVEEGDAAGGLEAFLKGAEGIEHLLAVGILDKGNLKANLAEGIGELARVGNGIREFAEMGVFGIGNEERFFGGEGGGEGK